MSALPRKHGLLKTLANGVRSVFGYDAVEDRGRRKPPTVKLRSEDDESTDGQRGQLVTLGRDMRRNFSIAAWAVRKHLDYVSTFSFQSKIGDNALDQRIESLMGWWANAKNFDVSGRHGLSRFTRLIEAHRTVDGDILAVRIANGKIQAIEGDRVRMPLYQNIQEEWFNRVKKGVVLNEHGSAESYAICKRGSSANSFVFEKLVPAEYATLVAYYDRFDQVRGISPFVSALNSLRDVFEGFDLALAKSKVAQMIALKMTGFDTEGASAEIDWGRGPVSFRLAEGEDIQLLQSNTPSTEWQAFMNMTIGASLKALDIPFLFYDESIGNYSKDRSAWLQYDKSCEQKREGLREWLDEITRWRLGMFIAFGTLELPNGFNIERDMKWSWAANRVPWIDPLKEVQAFKLAANGGFDSTVAIANRMGNDAYELADDEAAYQTYRESKGLQRTDVPLAPVPITIHEAA